MSDARLERAEELLMRVVKYATEDRAVTPGCTRLARVILEARRFLGIPDGPACSEGKARSAVEGAQPRAGLEPSSESSSFTALIERAGPLPTTGMAGAGMDCRGCGKPANGRFHECAPAVGRPDVDAAAKLFHDTYERLAPQYGWKTQAASAVTWEALPTNQRELMVRVVNVVLDDIGYNRPAPVASSGAPISAMGALKPAREVAEGRYAADEHGHLWDAINDHGMAVSGDEGQRRLAALRCAGESSASRLQRAIDAHVAAAIAADRSLTVEETKEACASACEDASGMGDVYARRIRALTTAPLGPTTKGTP
jgi:hypothetical protein